MRYLLFFVLLWLPLPSGVAGNRDALLIKVRGTVSEADTRQATELLHQLPKLSPVAAAARLSDLLKEKDLPRDTAAPWFDLIARAGGPEELQQIYVGLVTAIADDCCEGAPGADFDRALAFSDENVVRLATRALVEAAEKRGVRPTSPYRDGRLHLGKHMYWQCPEGMAPDLIRLVPLFQVKEDYEVLVQQLARPALHGAAYKALLMLEEKEAADLVEGTCRELGEPLASQGALLILARTAPERALAHTARILSAPMADIALRHLWQQLLEAEPYLAALTETVPKYLPQHVREIGQAIAGEKGLDLLASRLQPGGSIPAAQFSGLAEDSRLQGDSRHGEIVFRGETAACASCHALGKIGARSGPDLARIGVDRPPAELVSRVLQPAIHVTDAHRVGFLKENVVETILPGTGTSITLPKLTHAAADSIILPFSGSAMPTGLLDDLSLQSVRDLFAFLQQLGAPGGLDAANLHVARQWRIESDSPTRPGDSINRHQPTGGTDEVTSLINGDLRREDCLNALYDTDRDRTFYVATYFTVAEAATTPAHFTFTGITKAWLDGTAIANPAPTGIELPLSPGRHRIDIRLIPSQMPSKIRVECAEVTFSTEPLYPSH